MKFNYTKTIFFLMLLASFTAPMQGMSYLKAAYNNVKHFFYPETAITDIVKDSNAAIKQIVAKMPASVGKINNEQRMSAPALMVQPVRGVDTNIDYEKAARRLGMIANHLGIEDECAISCVEAHGTENAPARNTYRKVTEQEKQQLSFKVDRIADKCCIYLYKNREKIGGHT